MAAAILQQRLAERGVDARVTSAGTMPWSSGATKPAVKVSRSTLSSKHGFDSDEHCLVSPSQATDSLTGGELGPVLASLAWQARPAPSLKSCSSSLVALPELQANASSAQSQARWSIEGRTTDARCFMSI